MKRSFIFFWLLIIVGFILAKQHYDLKQYEKKFRKEFHEINADKWLLQEQELKQFTQTQVKMDVLNHYPNLFLYFDFVRDISVDEKSIDYPIQKIKLQMCSDFKLSNLIKEDMSEFSPTKIRLLQKALVNVVEQDQINWIVIIRGEYTKELLRFKYKISDCPNV